MDAAHDRLAPRARRLEPGLLRRLACEHLLQRLSPAAAPPLVAELGRAREKGALKGATGVERFDDFVERLAEPGTAARGLKRYPGLQDHLLGLSDAWVGFMIELLERLESDWPLLAGEVGGAGLAGVRVADVRCAGDLHRGGRCVAVVELVAEAGTGEGRVDGAPDAAAAGSQSGRAGEGGDRVRWVYKPRDVGAERAFGHLVETLGPHLPEDHILPRVEARDGYGWMAHVPHRPCRHREDVAAFHRRFGSLTALLHLVLARDVHAENVVACGPHPVVVDLEGVMPPRFAFHRRPEDVPRAHLLRCLVLPRRLPVPGGWADPTAVGGVEGRGGPLRRRWRRAGTDRMEPVWRPVRPGPARNRPVLDGEAAEPLEWEDDFVAGFAGAWEAVARRREALLGPDSPLEAFRGIRQRVAPRGTARYAFALERSYAARAWREEGGRAQVLDSLLENDPRPGVAELVAPHERAALMAGDIPIFQTRCGGTEVWSGRGDRVGLDAVQSGLDAVLAHLKTSFDPTGLRLQRVVVRQAFEARRRNRKAGTGLPEPAIPALDVPAIPAAEAEPVLLALAHGGVDRLLSFRVARGERTAWPTLLRIPGGGWQPGLTGRGAARGVAGIAWVLERAGELLERSDCVRAAGECRKRLASARSEGEGEVVSRADDGCGSADESPRPAHVGGRAGALATAWERALEAGEEEAARVRGAWCRGLPGAGKTAAAGCPTSGAGSGHGVFLPGLEEGEAGRVWALLRVLFPERVPPPLVGL